jgi:hypothetical protein
MKTGLESFRDNRLLHYSGRFAGGAEPGARPSKVSSSVKGWPDWSPTARVQRGPSEAARCASKGD